MRVMVDERLKDGPRTKASRIEVILNACLIFNTCIAGIFQPSRLDQLTDLTELPTPVVC